MDSIFRGDLSTARGYWLAWIDSLLVDHAVFRLVWSNFHARAPRRADTPLRPEDADQPAWPDRQRFGRTEPGGGGRAGARICRHAVGEPGCAATRSDPAIA